MKRLRLRGRIFREQLPFGSLSLRDRTTLRWSVKGIGDWNGLLPGRIVMAGNNLPNFGSHAAATAARLLIFPFDVS